MEKPKKKTKSKATGNGGDIGSHHDRQLPRLSRTEGQVRGLQKMIEAERNCLDIMHQISAVISALRRVQTDMTRDHLAALGEIIVADNLSLRKKREMTDELVALLKRLS